jgi:TonB family protein
MDGGLAVHMAESWKQWEGTVIDGFRLDQYLGGSDHSAVFTSHLPESTGEKVVIKFVPVTPESLDLQRVSWESAARVADPHLIQLHGTGRCRLGNSDFLYLVMEFADEDLAEILPQRALSPEEVREMLPAILETLGRLHQKGLALGAMKPANVLAVRDQLKLASDHVWPASVPYPKGENSAYTAPEMADGKLSAPADLWSLGVTLFEILTQRAPDGNSHSTATAADALPMPFATIVRRCLEPDPEKRCSLADISRALTAPPVAASTPVYAVGTAESGRQAFAPASYEAEESAGTRGPSASGSGLRLLKLAGAILLVLAVVYAGSRLFRGKTDGTSSTNQAASQSSAPADRGAVSADAAKPSPEPSARQSGASASPASRTPGSVLERVEPNVSASARATITGKVRVRVRLKVDESGNVSQASLESAGPSRYFAGKALDAARRWKFNPAQSDGHPVASAWRLRFEFGRGGTQVYADHLSP